jgi:hypothetical protein
MKHTNESNEKTYKEHQHAANIGSLPDNENPAFILNMTSSSLLSQIAKGEIDIVWLAKKQLANRGQNLDGMWVGFAAAEEGNFK